MFVAPFPNSETPGSHHPQNNCLWDQSSSRWSISHCHHHLPWMPPYSARAPTPHHHHPCVQGPSLPFSLLWLWYPVLACPDTLSSLWGLWCPTSLALNMANLAPLDLFSLDTHAGLLHPSSLWCGHPPCPALSNGFWSEYSRRKEGRQAAYEILIDIAKFVSKVTLSTCNITSSVCEDLSPYTWCWHI